MPTIALIDDDQHILASVTMAFEAEGFLTQIYSNGETALGEIQETPPDVAILDINMPGLDDMEFRRMRQRSDLPVIILTSKDNAVDELYGLKMGADDFLHKPCSHRLLTERVKALLRRVRLRETVVVDDSETRAIECGKLFMDPERHVCIWGASPVSLSQTEFKILHALARHPGIIKDRNDLMDVAYDATKYVDDRTIDGHIKTLRKKLVSVDREFNAIETLYGRGYRFKDC